MSMIKVYPVIVEKPKFSEVCHNLWKRDDGLCYCYSTDEGDRIGDSVPIDICFVSDREIKTGNHYTDTLAKYLKVWKMYPEGIDLPLSEMRRVEASTDTSLGLPLIPQFFIDDFVEKQTKIDYVYLHAYTSIIESFNAMEIKLSLINNFVTFVKK